MFLTFFQIVKKEYACVRVVREYKADRMSTIAKI